MTSITPQDIEQLENYLASARLQLGLSFNTLGQIKRFAGDLAAATGAYSEALEIFSREDVQDFEWQVKALHSRGESHRRLAGILFKQRRFKACQEYEERASNDLQRSLDFCDQYGIKEKHTVYRRMGRLSHDRAMRTEDKEHRLAFLEQARNDFEKGLEAARESENVLEELENLTEIAFLVDDRLDTLKAIQGQLKGNAIKLGDEDIESLRVAVENQNEFGQDFYLLPVFEHLLELEEGAFCFIQEKYEKALEFYIQGYSGLAQERGYGVARFRQHTRHLINQLRKLDQPTAIEWAETFIKVWEQTSVKLPDGSTQTLSQIHPDLSEEMHIYLDTAFLTLE